MSFKPDTQDQLKISNIVIGESYLIEYPNKDYYNGEETIEKGKGVAFINDGNIYFNVVDPYGMDKMVMKVRLIK